MAGLTDAVGPDQHVAAAENGQVLGQGVGLRRAGPVGQRDELVTLDVDRRAGGVAQFDPTGEVGVVAIQRLAQIADEDFVDQDGRPLGLPGARRGPDRRTEGPGTTTGATGLP